RIIGLPPATWIACFNEATWTCTRCTLSTSDPGRRMWQIGRKVAFCVQTFYTERNTESTSHGPDRTTTVYRNRAAHLGCGRRRRGPGGFAGCSWAGALRAARAAGRARCIPSLESVWLLPEPRCPCRPRSGRARYPHRRLWCRLCPGDAPCDPTATG